MSSSKTEEPEEFHQQSNGEDSSSSSSTDEENDNDVGARLEIMKQGLSQPIVGFSDNIVENLREFSAFSDVDILTLPHRVAVYILRTAILRELELGFRTDLNNIASSADEQIEQQLIEFYSNYMNAVGNWSISSSTIYRIVNEYRKYERTDHGKDEFKRQLLNILTEQLYRHHEAFRRGDRSFLNIGDDI